MLKDWEYESIITKDKTLDMVEIKLQQVPPEDLHEEILSHATEVEPEEDEPDKENTSKEKSEKPSFGARPQFDFKKELE